MFERLLMTAVLLATGASAHADEPPLRDPTQPFRPVSASTAAASSAPRFTLTAILIADLRQVAVVNGRPYRQGDRVGGAELVRIEPNAVHLRDGNQSFVIRLASARRPARQPEGDPGQ